MIYITGFKIAPGKANEALQAADKLLASPPPGVKFLHQYYTFGRYDAIWIWECASEKDAMKALFPLKAVADSETFVAIPRAEMRKQLKI